MLFPQYKVLNDITFEIETWPSLLRLSVLLVLVRRRFTQLVTTFYTMYKVAPYEIQRHLTFEMRSWDRLRERIGVVPSGCSSVSTTQFALTFSMQRPCCDQRRKSGPRLRDAADPSAHRFPLSRQCRHAGWRKRIPIPPVGEKQRIAIATSSTQSAKILFILRRKQTAHLDSESRGRHPVCARNLLSLAGLPIVIAHRLFHESEKLI